jgi:hypothetical protein
MPNPRKYFPNGSVLFATASLEQGLLLLSNPLCQCILKSCLVKALNWYPVKLCHFIVQANHVHMLYVVKDPSDAARFMGYFKAEVAHRMNIVFGWKKRTVWCEGYDSPVILSPIRVLIAISYLYSNPAKDGLVESINKFPGLSSWKMYKKGQHTAKWKHIRRPAFRFLAKDAHNLQAYTREADRILTSAKKTEIFQLQPNAWLEAFGITETDEQNEWNKRLFERIRVLEDRAKQLRQAKKTPVMGRTRLLTQKMTLNYKSKRSGKRMWCLSHKRLDRVKFIQNLKALIEEASQVFKNWHLGDYSLSYPAGLFPPGMPKIIEPLPV